MQVAQASWRSKTGWSRPPESLGQSEAQLVLVFGARSALEERRWSPELAAAFPAARFAGCSTAGEIHGRTVLDETVTATAVSLAAGRIGVASVRLDERGSLDAGRRLGAALDPVGLAHVFILSDGLRVNGTGLVRGLSEVIPPEVAITGGLAGDGSRFQRTLVLEGERADDSLVAAVAFYGSGLRVGYGSMGGWDPFGPDRLVTRSRENVLYELDGEPALDVYKRYLGPAAAALPSSALRFPLLLKRERTGQEGLVRTIFAVDELAGSMTFSGDIPEGHHARLMKANFDRLVDGATGAANASRARVAAGEAELAILVSCVGRKLVLKQRIEEEIEAVAEVLGPGTMLTGFYSYGEISPLSPTSRCELHNQTMTITTFAEVGRASPS